MPIDNVILAAQTRPGDLIALDEALSRLEALSERQRVSWNARCFAGMDVEETAKANDHPQTRSIRESLASLYSISGRYDQTIAKYDRTVSKGWAL